MARANGKVILFGEHAVVYGVPAIAAGVDRGVNATAARADQATLAIGARHVAPDDGSDLGRAYSALLSAVDAPPMSTHVESRLPAGCGLGASAAIGVATARAVLDAMTEQDGTATEPPERLTRVLAAANAWECVFHGNPSGIDAAAAALGGTILYSREDGARSLHLRRALTLAVAIAGPPAATREMVAGVANLRARRPEIVDKALEGIHAIVRNAQLFLRDGDLPSLGQLMDLNHMLLSGLFLSTEEIEHACSLARKAGALGSKLTGAGGGGAVVALVRDPQPVIHAWRGAGFECFATTVTPGCDPDRGEHDP